MSKNDKMNQRKTLRMSDRLEGEIGKYAEENELSEGCAMRALMERGLTAWLRDRTMTATAGQ